MISSDRLRHTSFIDEDDDDQVDETFSTASLKKSTESLIGFVKLDLIMLFSHYTNH